MSNETEYENAGLIQEEFFLAGDAFVPPAANSALKQALLARLLVMAQRYRQEGHTRQATEMFWALIKDHADTPESDTAKAELLKLAEGYERSGNLHMARGMYEQLMDLES